MSYARDKLLARSLRYTPFSSASVRFRLFTLLYELIYVWKLRYSCFVAARFAFASGPPGYVRFVLGKLLQFPLVVGLGHSAISLGIWRFIFVQQFNTSLLTFRTICFLGATFPPMYIKIGLRAQLSAAENVSCIVLLDHCRRQTSSFYASLC